MSEAFDPSLRRAARVLPRGLVGPKRLPVLRAATRVAGFLPSSCEAVLQVSSTARVRLHRPAGLPDRAPALLWIHGGGYVLGQAKQDDRLCRHLAEAAGVVVAAVDYRLAPEHPHPAALDDCAAALRWLADQPFVDPARVAVGGASAGGGLAAALAVRAREESLPVAFQLLVYPMLDDRTVLVPDQAPEHRRMWDEGSNAFAWSAYLGRAPGGDGVPPSAAAARTVDLSGLPRTWLGVGSLDLFAREGREYADRLTAAGVPCDLHVVPGAFHGFDAVVPRAAASRAFVATQVAALREALHT